MGHVLEDDVFNASFPTAVMLKRHVHHCPCYPCEFEEREAWLGPFGPTISPRAVPHASHGFNDAVARVSFNGWLLSSRLYQRIAAMPASNGSRSALRFLQQLGWLRTLAGSSMKGLHELSSEETWKHLMHGSSFITVRAEHPSGFDLTVLHVANGTFLSPKSTESHKIVAQLIRARNEGRGEDADFFQNRLLRYPCSVGDVSISFTSISVDVPFSIFVQVKRDSGSNQEYLDVIETNNSLSDVRLPHIGELDARGLLSTCVSMSFVRFFVTSQEFILGILWVTCQSVAYTWLIFGFLAAFQAKRLWGWI